ncbi:MAG: 4'-phosphopantetheinyl transferase family protein [bacterium]
MSETWKIVIPADFPVEYCGFHIFNFRFSAPLSAKDADQINLTEVERQRATKFHRRIDRNRFVVGRSMLRQALGVVLEVNPKSVPISIEKGRPFLDPSVNESVFFNISHSGNSVMLIFSRDNQPGIDVEIHADYLDMDQVAKRVMTRDEFDSYINMEPIHRGEAFYRLWVRKEAVLKCMGTGFGIEPKKISVGHDPQPLCESIFEGKRYLIHQYLHAHEDRPHYWAFAYAGNNEYAKFQSYPVAGRIL